MKKKKSLIIIVMVLAISLLSLLGINYFNKPSYAAGNIDVSPTSLTIEEGSSQSFTITSDNVVGHVIIESSNSGVATISHNFWETGMVAENTRKTGTITVSGVSVGSATITLTITAGTYDGDSLNGQTRTVNVNVVPKQANNNTNNDTGGNNTSNDNGNSNNNGNINNNINNNTSRNSGKSQNNNTEKKSDNNNVKEFSVDGYKVKKIDDNNYSLDVSREAKKINIKVTCEDEKAIVKGAGEKTLQDGENKFEIVITSESGKDNKINLIVKRISVYALKDLDTALNDKSDKAINIKMDSNDSITSKDLLKIKESGKIVYLLNDDNPKYSFIIDGKKLSNIDYNFSTDVIFISEYENEILKISNNAKGKLLHFSQKNQFPDGIMLKLYVSDKFSDSDKINVYYYDSNGNKLVEKDKSLSIDDGYVQFKLSNVNDHLVTNAVIENNKVSLPIILFIIVVIILIMVIMFLIIKVKKKSIINDEGMKSIVNEDFSNNLNNNVGINDIDTNTNLVDNSTINDVVSDVDKKTEINPVEGIESNNEQVLIETDKLNNNELSDIDNNHEEETNNDSTSSFDNKEDNNTTDMSSVSSDNNLVSDTSKVDTTNDNKGDEPVIIAVTEEYDSSSVESDKNNNEETEEIL